MQSFASSGLAIDMYCLLLSVSFSIVYCSSLSETLHNVEGHLCLYNFKTYWAYQGELSSDLWPRTHAERFKQVQSYDSLLNLAQIIILADPDANYTLINILVLPVTLHYCDNQIMKKAMLPAPS